MWARGRSASRGREIASSGALTKVAAGLCNSRAAALMGNIPQLSEPPLQILLESERAEPSGVSRNIAGFLAIAACAMPRCRRHLRMWMRRAGLPRSRSPHASARGCPASFAGRKSTLRPGGAQYSAYAAAADLAAPFLRGLSDHAWPGPVVHAVGLHPPVSGIPPRGRARLDEEDSPDHIHTPLKTRPLQMIDVGTKLLVGQQCECHCQRRCRTFMCAERSGFFVGRGSYMTMSCRLRPPPRSLPGHVGRCSSTKRQRLRASPTKTATAVPVDSVNIVGCGYAGNDTISLFAQAGWGKLSAGRGIKPGCPSSGSGWAISFDPVLRRLKRLSSAAEWGQ